MAVVFGGKSTFLAKKLWFLFFAGLVIILVFLGAAYLAPQLTGIGLWAVAGVCIVMIAAERMFGVIERRFNRVDSGMLGEGAIIKELKKLPDDFVVFRGLMIGAHQDIDCAVVGPTGIYAVEVKSHKGTIGFDGNALTRNGRPLEKDFFKETMTEAVGLRALIDRTSKQDVFAEPVVVFSRASVTLGPQKIRNCYVIGKAWLNELLTTSRGYVVNGDTILKIAAPLADLVNDRHKEEKIKQLVKAVNRPV